VLGWRDTRSKAGRGRVVLCYLEDSGVIDLNPTWGIPRPKQEVRQARVLGEQASGHTSLQTASVYVSLARELMDQQLQANAL